MFHAALFALLGGLFLLFAFSAVRADQFLIAVPAALLALWMEDGAFRAARGAHRRRANANRTDSNADGQR